MIKKQIVFCETCGECLGEEIPNYAKEHLILFPNHRSFLVKTLYDPLILDNPDEWFDYHIPRMRDATNRQVTPIKTTEEEKEPVLGCCFVGGTQIFLLPVGT